MHCAVEESGSTPRASERSAFWPDEREQCEKSVHIRLQTSMGLRRSLQSSEGGGG